ncbi:MAG: PKD domain-containing protein, partial [Bacteroidales bacterium]|nr:PKD domain-containing protein [Bacteroidales bacterium]
TGEMAPASGINSSGLSIFANGINHNWNYSTNAGYEPYAFTFRKALEAADYNLDGINNMLDIRDAISSNSQGYAWGSNFSASAPSTAIYDSLIAMVAEVCPEEPYITFRTNSYNDTLPGDNLYAANSEIKRHNLRLYCSRYLAIVDNIGDGTGISSQENWDLMKNYSNGGYANMQFMQYIPEWGQLNLSVYRDGTPAYMHDPVTYDVTEFFQLDVPVADFTADTTVVVEGDSVHFTDLSANNPTSWEWEFESGTPETSNEQNPIIKYEIPGDYDVKLIVNNTYGSDTILKMDYIHVDSLSTAIKTYNSQEAIFHPNPVKDKIFISCKDNIQSVEILNYSGQVVKKLESNTKQIEINIADLPTGIYFIWLKVGEEDLIKKIIKL